MVLGSKSTMDGNHSPTVAVTEFDACGSVGHFDDRDASGGIESDVAQRLDSVGGLLAELEDLDSPRIEVATRRRVTGKCSRRLPTRRLASIAGNR